MKKFDKWFWLGIAMIIVLIVLSIATSGCNTVYGLGRDIKTISAPYTTDD